VTGGRPPHGPPRCGRPNIERPLPDGDVFGYRCDVTEAWRSHGGDNQDLRWQEAPCYWEAARKAADELPCQAPADGPTSRKPVPPTVTNRIR